MLFGCFRKASFRYRTFLISFLLLPLPASGCITVFYLSDLTFQLAMLHSEIPIFLTKGIEITFSHLISTTSTTRWALLSEKAVVLLNAITNKWDRRTPLTKCQIPISAGYLWLVHMTCIFTQALKVFEDILCLQFMVLLYQVVSCCYNHFEKLHLARTATPIFLKTFTIFHPFYNILFPLMPKFIWFSVPK